MFFTTLSPSYEMTSNQLAIPRPLAPGDLIRVVAPSGPFDSELLERGIRRLSPFRPVESPTLHRQRQGFLAGTDDERLDELQLALDDPRVRAILIARGGYGLSRIAPRLRLDRLREDPPWLIGFSDATVLHLLAYEAGVCSVHGPNGTTLADASQEDLERLLALLSGRRASPIAGLAPMNSVSSSQVEGPLFGGNLTVLFAEAASGRLRVPDGALLFLEDVTETSYRVDRMLTGLAQAGHFDRAAAILLGEFTGCSAGKFGVATEDVLAERLSTLPLPVLAGLPVGHGNRNSPLLLGGLARLDLPAGLLFPGG